MTGEDPYAGWSEAQLKEEIRRLKEELRERKSSPRAGSGSEYRPSVEKAANDLPEGAWLVDDFEAPHPPSGAGGWWTGADQNDMGTTIEPDPYERLKGGSPATPGYCGGIRGFLGPNEEPWTWAVLTVGLRPNNAPMDLTKFSALSFYTKGNGNPVQVQLQRAVVKDHAHFQARYEAPKKWERLRIPFSEFRQPGWGESFPQEFPDVHHLSFSPALHEAPYDFRVDDVAFLP